MSDPYSLSLDEPYYAKSMVNTGMNVYRSSNALGIPDSVEKAFETMGRLALPIDLKNKSIRERNVHLEKVNSEQAKEIHELEGLLKQLKGEGGKSYAQICAVTDSNKKLTQDKVALEMEIEALKQKLADKVEDYPKFLNDVQASSMGKINLLVEEVFDHRTEIARLREENLRLREITQQHVMQVAESEGGPAANVDEAKAKQDAKNLAKIAALKEKNRQLEARIDALLRRNAFSEGRAEALEEQINNGENERSAKKAKTTTDIPSI